VDSDLLRFLGAQKELKRKLATASSRAATSAVGYNNATAGVDGTDGSVFPAEKRKIAASSAAAAARSYNTADSASTTAAAAATGSTGSTSTPASSGTALLPTKGSAPAAAAVDETESPTSESSNSNNSVVESWLGQFFPFLGSQQTQNKQQRQRSQAQAQPLRPRLEGGRNETETRANATEAATTMTAPAIDLCISRAEEEPACADTTSVGSNAELSVLPESNTGESVTYTPTTTVPAVDTAGSVAPSQTTATVQPSSPSSSSSSTVGDVMDSYLGQYNSHRVAAVLMSKDGRLDAATALAAGERVQSQVLSRIARRRLRSFLKARDREWGVQRLASPEESPSSYRIEDVVDLLIDDFGLTAKDIAEVLLHTPGIALMRPRAQEGSNGESLQETMDRAFAGVLCGTLKLRKYDARKVLRNCPGLLTMRGSRSAEQVVDMLSRLEVSTNSIARDKNALPTLLSRPPSGIFRLVAFLSSDAVRMPVSKIGPLLRRPVCQDLLDAVVPVPRFARGKDDKKMDDTSDEALGDLISSDPGVLTALWGCESQMRRDRINDTYQKMSDTAWTLRHEIGAADLGKVVAAYPSVLLLDADRQILPAANYLMNELGIWEDDLPRVLQLYPTLLGIEVAQVDRVVQYLLSLDVTSDNLSSIFRSFPALLTLDVEKDVVPVVDFLRSIGIANVGRFISRLPPVLGYSVDRELKPKWEYIQSVFVEARFEVTRFPAFFSYPLERVIKTRFEYLQEVKRIPLPLVSLDQVLRYGDKDFAAKVAKDGDGGREFEAFIERRKSDLAASALSKRGGGGDRRPRNNSNNVNTLRDGTNNQS